jgi:hypothetical protein
VVPVVVVVPVVAVLVLVLVLVLVPVVVLVVLVVLVPAVLVPVVLLLVVLLLVPERVSVVALRVSGPVGWPLVWPRLRRLPRLRLARPRRRRTLPQAIIDRIQLLIYRKPASAGFLFGRILSLPVFPFFHESAT